MLIQALLSEKNHVQIEPGVHKLLANYQTEFSHFRWVPELAACRLVVFSVTFHRTLTFVTELVRLAWDIRFVRFGYKTIEIILQYFNY